MVDRVAWYRFVALALLSVGTGLIWWLPHLDSAAESPYLSVHFLDVGQGDAIFIQTPDGSQALIDGGPNNAVLRELATHLPLWDRTLDLVVATHPDTDHVGGLTDVLERYQVATILNTTNQGESPAAREYARLVVAEGAELVSARRGQVLTLGASTTLEVLWPELAGEQLESNASSIVLKLTYGETSFLLTGDAPKGIEEYLVLAHGEHLKSNVLKVGHHGSRTATSELFLAEVRPDYAVITAGRDNQYGHPHLEVTDALFNARVKTYSTAEDSTVTFVSDGGLVWRP